jgi:aminoglycoside phosphotransferase (APT) family kinase protein
MASGTGDGLGPEWYQRIRAHAPAEARRLLRHALGREVVRLRKDSTGASHAVYFALLADGLECVLRVVMHAAEDPGLEVWMAARCRERGVPVPEVLACAPAPRDGWPAYIITRRLPGVPAHPVRLHAAERGAVLRQMGTYLASIHTIPVSGFGHLVRQGNGFAGREPSLWTFLDHEIRGELGRLPDDALPPARRAAIYARFAAAREALDRPAAVACHGDYRLKNAVLAQENGRWRVSGVVDFEMAQAGDPAYDLAYFFYSLRSRPWTEADLAAICAGYGLPYPFPPDLRQRVLLYQVLAAVGHLWWAVSFKDDQDVRRVLAWLDEFETALGQRA